MLMNKKQLTLKLSAITISVLLASCGGGGGIMVQMIVEILQAPEKMVKLL